jgi:hypothetical protein
LLLGTADVSSPPADRALTAALAGPSAESQRSGLAGLFWAPQLDVVQRTDSPRASDRKLPTVTPSRETRLRGGGRRRDDVRVRGSSRGRLSAPRRARCSGPHALHHRRWSSKATIAVADCRLNPVPHVSFHRFHGVSQALLDLFAFVVESLSDVLGHAQRTCSQHAAKDYLPIHVARLRPTLHHSQ